MAKASLFVMVVGVFVFYLYLFLLQIFNLREKKEERNSFLNSFGYQFYSAQPLQIRLVLYLLLFASCLLIGVSEAVYFSSMRSYFFLILSFTFPLSLVFLTAGNVIPLSKYKAHILFSMMGFGFFSVSCLMFAFSSVVPGAVLYQGSINLVCQIVLGVIGALFFLLLFNPKLSDWAKMEKSEVNGTTYYLKPKVNYLALYEWGALFFETFAAVVLFANGILY